VKSVLSRFQKNCRRQLHQLCHYFDPGDSDHKKIFREIHPTFCGADYGWPREQQSVSSRASSRILNTGFLNTEL
jgi:hypothetical protein